MLEVFKEFLKWIMLLAPFTIIALLIVILIMIVVVKFTGDTKYFRKFFDGK